MSRISNNIFKIALVLSPVAYEIFYAVRISDLFFIILLLCFLSSNPRINLFYFSLITLITSSLLFSSFLGLILKNETDFTRYGFVYKYLFIFSLPLIISEIIKTRNHFVEISKIFLWQWIVLSSWSYIYVFLVLFDFLGGDIRPSFPFSNNYYISDAHLFSCYLGFGFSAYLIFLRRFFDHSFLISFLIILNGLFGLFLTGSRTGILLLALTLLYLLLRYIFALLNKTMRVISFKKNNLKRLLIIGLSAMVFLATIKGINFEKVHMLLIRATNFDLFNDSSSLGRLTQLQTALSDSGYSYYLFGLGMYSSSEFYDGILSLVIAQGGISLVVLLSFYSLKILLDWYRVGSNGSLPFPYLFFMYLVANFITEYMFVTRNAFPIISFLSILWVAKKKSLT